MNLADLYAAKRNADDVLNDCRVEISHTLLDSPTKRYIQSLLRRLEAAHDRLFLEAERMLEQ